MNSSITNIDQVADPEAFAERFNRHFGRCGGLSDLLCEHRDLTLRAKPREGARPEVRCHAMSQTQGSRRIPKDLELDRPRHGLTPAQSQKRIEALEAQVSDLVARLERVEGRAVTEPEYEVAYTSSCVPLDLPNCPGDTETCDCILHRGIRLVLAQGGWR